ncbi:FMN-binding protein [Fusibacter bizertensis]
MAKKKQILYPVLFMLIVTILYTSVLAFINESTASIIKAQEELRVKRSVLYVLDLPVSEVDAEVNALYDGKITEKQSNGRDYFEYADNNTVDGYAFLFSGTGLWGSITGYIAFNPDFTEVLGIDFVSHSETPGLGGRIDEPWFKEQFRGITVNSDQSIIVKPADGGTIDGITGASLTTDSVKKMVNAFIKDALTFAKEAKL